MTTWKNPQTFVCGFFQSAGGLGVASCVWFPVSHRWGIRRSVRQSFPDSFLIKESLAPRHAPPKTQKQVP